MNPNEKWEQNQNKNAKELDEKIMVQKHEFALIQVNEVTVDK